MDDERGANAVNLSLTPLQCDAEDYECERVPLDFPLTREHWIDNEVMSKGATPSVRYGVKFGDGDGTIATASLGAMCVRGWKGKTKWNPAGIEVVTQGECTGGV